MAEVIFKLLRCDAEASHMLGWAKKEVRRLMTYAGLDVFSRKWVFGDVTVTARVFDGVARLWLEAEEMDRLWFGFGKKVGMPSTRGLQIIRRQQPTPSTSYASGATGPCLWEHYDTYSFHGVVFASGTFIVNNCGSPTTQSFQTVEVLGRNIATYVYGTSPPLLEPLPAGHYLPSFSGTYAYFSSSQTHTLSGAYGEFQVPDSINDYGIVEVRLTDGTLLASAPHKRFYGPAHYSEAYNVAMRLRTHVSNQPKQEIEWSGGNELPLYDRVSRVWQPSQTLSFSVPDDVVMPMHSSDWNVSSWFYDQTSRFFNLDAITMYGYDDGEYIEPHASVWHNSWRAGREQARTRERQRRLTASNALLDDLRNKKVTAELRTFIKKNYPRSERVVRTTPLRIVAGPTYTRVAQTTKVVSPYYSYVDYERWEGRCTLAYTTVEDEVEVEHTKEYVGYCTWTKPVVSRRMPIGDAEPRHEYYTEYTYDNMPLLNTYGTAFHTVPVPGVQFVGATINKLCEAGELRIHDELFEPLFGTVSGKVVDCQSWIPTNDGVFGFYPVYTSEVGLVTPSPMSEVDVVFDHTDWFRGYLSTAGKVRGLRKDETSPGAQFLSSALARNTTITVVPLSAMAGNEERGMFPYDFSDVWNYQAPQAERRLITALKLYGYATLSYSESTDTFEVSKWTEFSEPKILDIAEYESKHGIVLDSWLGSNCVCLSAVQWEDLRADAKEQHTDMKKVVSENEFPVGATALTKAALCLYVAVKEAVLDAMKPPEPAP